MRHRYRIIREIRTTMTKFLRTLNGKSKQQARTAW